MSGVATQGDPSARLLTVEEREDRIYASYALFSRESKGRRWPEPDHPYRGPFQRDRDRILHSAAFRRLSGKMQVFTGERGDYHRTRLTHTQEVASIARTIGRALRLNEDLVEALALFHDIGHPPFGHAGEDALDAFLRDEGGFSHNRYALTIAEELETRGGEHRGLNLTAEVLDGQSTRICKDDDARRPPLEAQVVDAADSITYDAHDTDDAVKLGLVTLDELQEEVPLVHEALNYARSQYPNLDAELLRKAVVHRLIDRQVTDLIAVSGAKLLAAGFDSSSAARNSDWRIGGGVELQREKEQLERFLYDRVYRHDELIEMRGEAQKRLGDLFQHFLAKPDQLPPRYRQRIDEVGAARAVGDYLAGMTDRFCDDLHRGKD
ncbi:MAG: dNTP triphosphohydrolase [Pirellulaceae bacterium]|jgi:dGTPase|nr:dNTP triphosphohydrolase [Pirellulaceae bacterium]